MRAVVQRVVRARVEVEGEITGAIEKGLVAFVGAGEDDTEADVTYTVGKVVGLRVFPDDAGKMSRALADAGGALLVVSQFTLAADTSRGNRPSFIGAAGAERGRALYERVVAAARRLHAGSVACGEFGADMQVALVNDGPVTIPITLRG